MKKLFALIGLLGLVAGMGGALKAQEEAGDTQSKLDTVVLFGIGSTFNEERPPKIRFSATPGEKFVINWNCDLIMDTILVKDENEIEVSPSRDYPHFMCYIYLYALNPSGHITNIRIDSTYSMLQLRNCPLVDTINVAYNNLTSFDIHNCPAVKYIDISHNKLSALYFGDVSNIIYLDISYNDIVDITEQGYTSLETLDCSYNRRLRQLGLSDCKALTDLTVRCNDSLKLLQVSNLPLQHLTCTENQKLSQIIAINCRFQALDVSGNPALEMLECNYNQLTSLTFKNCPTLTYIDCNHNKLSYLDLSDCKSLRHLYCSNNRISTMEIPEDMILENLDCDSNQLSMVALFSIFKHALSGIPYPQIHNAALQVGNILDLQEEVNIHDQMKWSLLNTDGYWIDSVGIVVNKNGLFYFKKAGNYRLILYTEELLNHEGEGMYAEVRYDLTVVDSVVRPQFSIPSGAVLPDTELVLSTPMPDARIHYTTDGSEPNENALLYQEPIRFTEAMTVKAIAIQDTFKSHIAIATYTIDTEGARPAFSIPSGKVKRGTTVSLSTATPNIRIIYTTDGSEPDNNALEYAAPIRINEAMTIKAVAIYTNIQSQVATATYTIDSVANEHDLRASKLRVYAKDRTIYLSETVGEVEVFTMDGTCVYRGYDTAISVERSGIYIVSAAGRRWKVVVR